MRVDNGKAPCCGLSKKFEDQPHVPLMQEMPVFQPDTKNVEMLLLENQKLRRRIEELELNSNRELHRLQTRLKELEIEKSLLRSLVLESAKEKEE
jgi:hypothetical protein